MSDYKGIFTQEYFTEDDKPMRRISLDLDYQVKVMHRKTNEVVWAGIVKASSGKDAQKQWRKEYPQVRIKYDHSYCLIISRI